MKQSRASKPKVRTGCVTCKIRRVKCDEKFPSCLRCSDTGRICDGYKPVEQAKSTSASSSGSSPASPCKKDSSCRDLEYLPIPSGPLAITLTNPEHVSLAYFHLRTAPGLCNHFDNDFWNCHILQLSHNEPAIRHALVAIGALHQQFELHARPLPRVDDIRSLLPKPVRYTVKYVKSTSDENRKNAFALGQYNKAIRLLSCRLQDASMDVELVLLSSLLFICIEFLRGDPEPAMIHFRAGLQIATKSLASNKSVEARAMMKRIQTRVLPFFNRLELLSMLFGISPVGEYSTTLADSVPDVFENVQQARDSLVHLYNIGVRLEDKIGAQRARNVDITSETQAESAAIQERLEMWQIKCEALLLTHLSRGDAAALTVLRIQYCVAIVLLGTMTDPDVSEFQFATAIALAESLEHDRRTDPQDHDMPASSFLFDMELVSPLYYIGIKCESSYLRDRTVGLLRRTIRREGLWDSNAAAAVIERVAELKNDDFGYRLSIPSYSIRATKGDGHEFDSSEVQILRQL